MSTARLPPRRGGSAISVRNPERADVSDAMEHALMAGKDCDDLLHELADFLHGELTPDRQDRLRQHLDDCPPCLETADFQDQLRSLIAKRCCEQVPMTLRVRIEALLSDPSVSPGPDAGS